MLSPRNKSRLVVLPILAGSVGLLGAQYFLPHGSDLRLVADSAGMIFFGAYLVWYLTRGQYVIHELAGQMHVEKQIDSLGARWRSVEDRLDELEHLKRRDMVTPEEYATKRAEILKDL